MSVLSLVIAFCAIIFWLLRVAVAFTASMGIEFVLEPLNLQVEIILAFVTFACILLIFRRSLIGSLVYMVSNLGYYGVYLFNILQNMEEGTSINYLNVMVSIIGILIPIIAFIDVGMSQSRKKTSNKTKKTDWYFQNEKYDREYDERADKNQYKF